jgi:hypothetical protein
MLLYGTRSGDRKMARDGFWAILAALGLFAVGLVFFEGIIGISGERLPLPNWVLPVAVIVIGVLVLLRGLTFRGQIGRDWGGADWHGGAPGESGSPPPSHPDDFEPPREPAAAAHEEPREDS